MGSESTLRWEGLQAGGDFERLGVAECTTWFLPSDVRNHSAQMRYSADARGRESEVGFHGTGGTPQFGPFRTRLGQAPRRVADFPLRILCSRRSSESARCQLVRENSPDSLGTAPAAWFARVTTKNGQFFSVFKV